MGLNKIVKNKIIWIIYWFNFLLVGNTIAKELELSKMDSIAIAEEVVFKIDKYYPSHIKYQQIKNQILNGSYPFTISQTLVKYSSEFIFYCVTVNIFVTHFPNTFIITYSNKNYKFLRDVKIDDFNEIIGTFVVVGKIRTEFKNLLIFCHYEKRKKNIYGQFQIESCAGIAQRASNTARTCREI